MNRRGFVKFLGILFPVLALVGCDSDDEKEGDGSGAGDDKTGGDDGGSTLACSADAAVTYTNPGHAHVTTVLTKAEIDTAAVGLYTLMPTPANGHPHSFQLDAQDFVDLQDGQTVTKTDDEGHGHTITIVC